MPNTKQQQQAETFEDPNKDLVVSGESIDADADQVKLHNEETLLSKKGYPDNYVQIRQIFTDADTEPNNEVLTDQDKKRIAGYNATEYQQELDKEKFAKIAYMIWQSKQLYYTAFRYVGWNETTGKMEWEQRDYTYHKLTNGQKLELKKYEAKLNALVNKNNLMRNGFINQALFDELVTNRDQSVDEDIEDMRNELVNRKFTAYFLENNEEVLNDIGFPDRRDLVEAAEYRETGVPFSRRLASYRTMSASVGAKAPSKS